MSKQQIIRMTIDFAMTIILLLQMGYLRIGETVHEWLGITMFILFIIHHILNRRWMAEIFHGRYTSFRVFQTALVVLLCLTMIGSAISGIMVSKHVFTFMDIRHISFARNLHMLCGYWNFVLMSLHLGLHWIMITGMVSRMLEHDDSKHNNPELNTKPNSNPNPTAKESSFSRTSLLAARIIAALIAGYGIYVMFTRQIPQYLFGTVKFASFNITEPLPAFLFDYMAMMGLFVFTGHYVTKKLQKK